MLTTFETLVLPELDAAFNFARWMTGNASDAEDVVQDAAVRMLRFADTFRGGNARAWVLTIVRNTALTWLTTNRRRNLISLDTQDVDGESLRRSLVAHGEDGGDPAAIELQRSNREAVQGAIAGLPLEQREIVVLRDIEGLSYRDIAAILNVPAGTVMSRLARARDALEQRLKDPGGSHP